MDSLQEAVQKIVKSANAALQTASAAGKTVIFYDDMQELIEAETAHDFEIVAQRLHYSGARELFTRNGIEMNSNGDFPVPPRATPFGCVPMRGRAAVPPKGVRTFVASVQAKKPSIKIKVAPALGDPPAPEMRMEIHDFVGDRAALRPGMHVRIANGSVHFLPLIPEFLYENDMTKQIISEAINAYDRMVEELIRQHEAAISKARGTNEKRKTDDFF